MFRRSDKGTETDGPDIGRPEPAELTDETDDLGAPLVWTFATAIKWCGRQNWHLDGIESGNAVWLGGAAYMGRLVTRVVPEMSVQTPATFNRAAQTGEWSLYIHNLTNQLVFSTGAKPS